MLVRANINVFAFEQPCNIVEPSVPMFHVNIVFCINWSPPIGYDIMLHKLYFEISLLTGILETLYFDNYNLDTQSSRCKINCKF